MKFVFNVSGWLQNFNIYIFHVLTKIFLSLCWMPEVKPIGAYKCFLKPDVYDNLWHRHPAQGQKNFRQYMKNMLKFCSHPETLKTNFIEYVQ